MNGNTGVLQLNVALDTKPFEFMQARVCFDRLVDPLLLNVFRFSLRNMFIKHLIRSTESLLGFTISLSVPIWP